MIMTRWSSGVNVAGEPFIYDNHRKRQYWNDELHLICCQMNYYEDEIEKLEDRIYVLENPPVYKGW